MVYRLPFDKGNRRKGRSFSTLRAKRDRANRRLGYNTGYGITPCLSFRKAKNKAELNLYLNK